MKVLVSVQRPLHWLNLSGAMLVALLQRTPVLRLAATAEEMISAAPVGAIFRSTVLVAALGALDSRAGATTLVANTTSPLAATVGTAIQTVVFDVSDTQTPASSWLIGGTIAPGLRFGTLTGSGGTIFAQNPTLTGTPTTAGTFTFTLVARDQVYSSPAFSYTVNVSAAGSSGPPPAIIGQPQSVTAVPGQKVALLVSATGTGLTYQWSKSGVGPIAGATGSLLVLASVAAGDAGNYTCAVSSGGGTVSTNVAALTISAAATPGYLSALSLRGNVGAGAEVFFIGFVLDGAGGRILVKSVGPGIAAPPFSVPGSMADPKLDLVVAGSNLPLGSNDNWGGAADVLSANAQVAAFPLADSASKDAALVRTLPGGVFIATASGVSDTTGVSLIEFYGLDSPANLSAMSLRGRIGTGGDVFFVGFVISGSTSKTVLIKAVGPGIAAAPFNVPGAMVDPQLELSVAGSNVFLGSNNNWGGVSELRTANDAVHAFPANDGTSKDAMMLITLPPGVYIAKANGVSDTAGVALVEIYGL